MPPALARPLLCIMAMLACVLLPARTLLAAQAASPTAPTQLATVTARAGFDPTAIDAFLAQARFVHARWGVAVLSLDSGRMLYAHEAQSLLQTASTAKLFTAAAVLDQLGPQARIPTRVLGSGIDAAGRLAGDLVLQGMGDPSLGVEAETADWAQQLARQLAQRGLRQINGDLIADDTYFSGPPYGNGWEAEDLQTWYGAATSALSVNENIAEVTVEPANRRGHRAGLVVKPTGAIPQIDSQLETGASRDGDAINLYLAPGSHTLQAFGRIGLHAPAQRFKLAMPDPARSAGLILADALRAQGIRLQGKVLSRHWPQPTAAIPRLRRLAEVRSPTLAAILQQGLKRSQNLYLQNLLQWLGVDYAATHPDPVAGNFRSSADAGLLAVQALLPRAGIDGGSVQVNDGTGMSRRSLATPLAMVRLLAWVARQPYAASFRQGLPLAAVDGTLASHFRNSEAANNLQAKTGSMSLVHCLAGYVTSTQGEHLAFAIMLNNYVAPTGAPSISHDVDHVALLLTREGLPMSMQGRSDPVPDAPD